MSNDFLAFLFFALLFASSLLQGIAVFSSATLFATFLAAVLIRERRYRQRRDFINQLKSHRRELRNSGTVAVDGILLRYDSVLTTYHLQTGFLLTSIVIPSKHRLLSEVDHAEALLYSLISLLSGWWSFPSGPLVTMQIVHRNMNGGEKASVARHIDGILIDRLEAEARARKEEDPHPPRTLEEASAAGAGSPARSGPGLSEKKARCGKSGRTVLSGACRELPGKR